MHEHPTGGTSVNSSVAHPARVYNAWLGGRDNYPADQEAAELAAAANPRIVPAVRANRAFLGRAVRELSGTAGIRQFLDIGTGIPTADNTHEVAQRVAPDARIVYVDNDPVVLAHAHALLTSTREGRTAYLDADLYEPEAVLEAAAGTLDLSRPVALMILNTLGHVADHGRARDLVARLMAGLPSGSYLVISDSTATSEGMIAASEAYNKSGAVPYHVRSVAEIAAFFDGLDVLEPGIVRVPEWRPDSETAAPAGVDAYCGVGRKH